MPDPGVAGVATRPSLVVHVLDTYLLDTLLVDTRRTNRRKDTLTTALEFPGLPAPAQGQD